MDAIGQPLDVDWPPCVADGCIGKRVGGHDRCLAHLDARDLDGVLARLGPQSNVDARGTTFTKDLLDRLLAAFDPGGEGCTFGDIRFDRARFDGDVRIHAHFYGAATFYGAEFRGDAIFGGAFHAMAIFTEAQFSESAEFGQATWFSGTQFSRIKLVENYPDHSADFTASQFQGLVEFHLARFDGDVTFRDATFVNPWFHGAEFMGTWVQQGSVRQRRTTWPDRRRSDTRSGPRSIRAGHTSRSCRRRCDVQASDLRQACNPEAATCHGISGRNDLQRAADHSSRCRTLHRQRPSRSDGRDYPGPDHDPASRRRGPPAAGVTGRRRRPTTGTH